MPWKPTAIARVTSAFCQFTNGLLLRVGYNYDSTSIRRRIVVVTTALVWWTSCRRAAATVCPAPLLPARGRQSAFRRRAGGNVAAVFHGQHVLTPTTSAAWRANTAVSKAAWWPWPLTLKVVSESRVTWATYVPSSVFLGLSVLDLGPLYATDRHMPVARGGSMGSIEPPQPEPRPTMVAIIRTTVVPSRYFFLNMNDYFGVCPLGGLNNDYIGERW